MARNIGRGQRPLMQALGDTVPEYKDDLIVRLEISSSVNPRPVLLGGHNLQHFDLDLRDAVDSPRLHHQWLPDQVRYEPLIPT